MMLQEIISKLLDEQDNHKKPLTKLTRKQLAFKSIPKKPVVPKPTPENFATIQKIIRKIRSL